MAGTPVPARATGQAPAVLRQGRRYEPVEPMPGILILHFRSLSFTFTDTERE